jgi:putative hydrolase
VGSEDNCRAIAAAVRDAGGWVALGSDSHTAFTLGEFTECRKILDAVDFPEERILNVSPRRLLNFLESRACRRSLNLLTFNLYNWNK